jgi:hypothetical protein
MRLLLHYEDDVLRVARRNLVPLSRKRDLLIHIHHVSITRSRSASGSRAHKTHDK